MLNPEDNNLLIPDFGAKVKKITFFGSGEKLKYRQDAFGIAISVPEGAFDEIDTILVMEL